MAHYGLTDKEKLDKALLALRKYADGSNWVLNCVWCGHDTTEPGCQYAQEVVAHLSQKRYMEKPTNDWFDKNKVRILHVDPRDHLMQEMTIELGAAL